MQKEKIKEIIEKQNKNLFLEEKTIPREKLKEFKENLPFAKIITGVRRCGKSTLLKQLMKFKKGFYYLNFEDPQMLSFEIKDTEKLIESFIEFHGKNKEFFFDEIQSLPKWELLVRSILDRKMKVTLTGSNSSLLSKELGTKLTGRNIRYELFPFSYTEFLDLKKNKHNAKNLKKYFEEGGFPEYLIYNKKESIIELFNNILDKDISLRYNIRNNKELKQLATYLISNIGKEFSNNSLKKLFNLGSVNTIINFISYLEDSYLLFTLPRFNYSYKKQIIAPKKIYCIDNGLANNLTTSFSKDKGRMLENLVFISLREKSKDLFYFKEDKECDFLIKEKNEIKKAIQSCYMLNEENEEREIQGILEAMKKFNLKEGTIITYDQEDILEVENKKIKVVPIWKWLMKKTS
jgi:uncharacterized protein